LDGLNAAEEASASPRSAAIRIYDNVELDRLDTAARGYLLHLEQVGILAPAQRELAIDRLLALDTDEIDIEQIKWVVMMVLFSQPGYEQAYAQMEDLVFADGTGWIHRPARPASRLRPPRPRFSPLRCSARQHIPRPRHAKGRKPIGRTWTRTSSSSNRRQKPGRSRSTSARISRCSRRTGTSGTSCRRKARWTPSAASR